MKPLYLILLSMGLVGCVVSPGPNVIKSDVSGRRIAVVASMPGKFTLSHTGRMYFEVQSKEIDIEAWDLAGFTRALAVEALKNDGRYQVIETLPSNAEKDFENVVPYMYAGDFEVFSQRRQLLEYARSQSAEAVLVIFDRGFGVSETELFGRQKENDTFARVAISLFDGRNGRELVWDEMSWSARRDPDAWMGRDLRFTAQMKAEAEKVIKACLTENIPSLLRKMGLLW